MKGKENGAGERKVHRERVWGEKGRASCHPMSTIVFINHTFLFPGFWCFDIWGLAHPGGTAPHRAGQFWEKVNNSPASVPFICTSHYSPVSVTPGARYQTALGPSPLKLLKLANPKPAYPVKTTIKTLVQFSSPSPCLLTHLGTSPCGTPPMT